MMDETAVADMVHRHPFLHGLSEAHLQLIASCASPTRFEAGAFLFREGQEAGSSYLLRSGRVALEIFVVGRGPVSVETVESGGVIGWSWLMTPHRWHFDARAVEPTRVIELHGSSLLAHCDRNPELGYELFKRFLPLFQNRIESLRMQLLDMYRAAEVP